MWLKETCLEMNIVQFVLNVLRRLRMKNCLDLLKIFKLSEMLWVMLSLGLSYMPKRRNLLEIRQITTRLILELNRTEVNEDFFLDKMNEVHEVNEDEGGQH